MCTHGAFETEWRARQNDGSYAGFDDKEPTSKDRGKPTVMQFLLDTHGADSVRPLIMIGDGATDLQAR